MPSLPPMNTSSEGFVPGRSSVTGPDPPPQMALWQELCGAHQNWRHFCCQRCRACQQSTATTVAMMHLRVGKAVRQSYNTRPECQWRYHITTRPEGGSAGEDVAVVGGAWRVYTHQARNQRAGTDLTHTCTKVLM